MNKKLINDKELEANDGDDRPLKTTDNEVLLMWLRGIELMVTTLNLFMNVYIMLSLDRFMISYALLTMMSCFLGQISAIVGQFGYSMARVLAIVYTLSALSLVLGTVFLGRVDQNFLLTASVAMTAITGLISGFVAFKQ